MTTPKSSLSSSTSATDGVPELFPRKLLWREGTDTKQEVRRETRLLALVNKPEVLFHRGQPKIPLPHELHKEEGGGTDRSSEKHRRTQNRRRKANGGGSDDLKYQRRLDVLRRRERDEREAGQTGKRTGS